MKVELLVNLKVADGSVIKAGKVFTDESGPIPENIMYQVNRGGAKVIDFTPFPVKKVVLDVIPEPEPEPVKKIRKKKGTDHG